MLGIINASGIWAIVDKILFPRQTRKMYLESETDSFLISSSLTANIMKMSLK